MIGHTLRLIASVLLASLLIAGCNDSALQAAAPPSSAPTTEASTEHTATESPVDAETPALANAADNDAPTSLQQYQTSLARRCESDSDCVVKNVGSCCGYMPQCVHKDVQTFPEQVKALCEKEGRSSICGFQEPAACSCVENQCRSAANSLQ